VLCDSARFLAADPDEIVAAAFACPVCLHRPDHVSVSDDGGDALAQCTCDGCAHAWDVALDPWQALRMSLAPPRLDVASV
jgi:hypothetical protein